VFSADAIAIVSGALGAGILALGVGGCHLGGDIPEPGPSVEITRIPAPKYVTPESTMPIMPTYGPGDAVEVAR
jgi:hypothetical protein